MASAASRRRRRTPPRATRSKPTISYAESSDSDSTNLEDVPSPAPSRTRITQNGKTERPAAPKRRHRASQSTSSIEGPSPKRRKASKASKPVAAHTSPIIQSTGVIPPWQSLPYHIFVQIFEYASYPLYKENFQPLPSGSWLLRVSRLCKAFAEPAFTVLYSSPPLVPMDKAHMLVNLLKADPARLSYKYRQKVQSLRIEVGQVAAYSLPGNGHLDLFSFVKDLPRLLDLEFYHEKDMSPYKNLEDSIKWKYPVSLFEALEYVDPVADLSQGEKTSVCRLRSWRWSSRLAGKVYPIAKIHEVHLKPSFIGLRKVAFVNYQIAIKKKGHDESPEHEKLLADAISALARLEHLIFESSSLLNSKLLPLLPKNLKYLEIINCGEVLPDDFSDFLSSHGRRLQLLLLHHNQCLNLSFLPVLGVACPDLQLLRMHLTYFNPVSYADHEPLYDQLLLPSEIPSWPRSLQTLELLQLRKWDMETAEMFFQSLLDSAAHLPDLRRLTLQAILNIGWRDRASFRDKWIGALERVFKRVSEPPKLFGLANSTPPGAAVKVKERKAETGIEISQKDRTHTKTKTSQPPALSETTSSTRRSARASTRKTKSGLYAESSETSDGDEAEYESKQEVDAASRNLARQNRVSRELQILRQTAGADAVPSSPPATTPEKEIDSDDEPLVRKIKDKGKGKGKVHEVIQGMCEVVDIRIDNLRPRETQVTEADFLDEEAPGDGDWNGDDDAEDGYAW